MSSSDSVPPYYARGRLWGEVEARKCLDKERQLREKALSDRKSHKIIIGALPQDIDKKFVVSKTLLFSPVASKCKKTYMKKILTSRWDFSSPPLTTDGQPCRPTFFYPWSSWLDESRYQGERKRRGLQGQKSKRRTDRSKTRTDSVQKVCGGI